MPAIKIETIQCKFKTVGIIYVLTKKIIEINFNIIPEIVSLTSGTLNL